MNKNEKLESIAINGGYTKEQVTIALNSLSKANVSVIEKEDFNFDIKNSDVLIHNNVSIDMVIEIGFDILRMDIESMIETGCEEEEIFKALSDLNNMYSNKTYVIREVDGEKYLGFQL